MRPHRLHWLDPERPDEPFPPREDALREPNGLLAIGGDLSPVVSDQIEGGESKFISAIAPTPACKDFRLKLQEAH